ncbi:YceI family protein [Aureispira anguillae]|uniref:YceI family protein n=1 Tax=Aureispira anguillae TaxID=2864201 RepID=A0A915YDF3_9BACT|nr:YceI family protein [Aureispira anguillae]BDS11054.1 YceI family protein [Aureispira anguillae]
MPKYITFLILLLSFSTIAQQKIDEELVIFVQKTSDSEFTLNNIATLEAYMQAHHIPTKIIDIDEAGAPKEVGFTPFIVYRNHLGRKVFKGRYTSHQRLLNFIRTVRRLPAEAIHYEEKEVFVWQQQHSNLFIKLKITAPNGQLPANFDAKKFKKDYLKGLKKGFEGAKYAQKHPVRNSDELIYCNFYPYIAEDGKVYVSSEIFSHYHCHTPIYQQYENPAVGNNTIQGFAAAAANSLAEIKRQLVESELGDAMNFTTKNTKFTPWEDLGLSTLSPPKQGTQTAIKAVTFPKAWEMAGALDEGTPILAFSFPPPLRQYAGELKQVDGSLSLKSNESLAEAMGKFEVVVSSIEMGESSLNSAVKESILKVDEHPTAHLVFKKIESKDFKLTLGKITQTHIEADLTLLGKTGLVQATAQFEPFLNDQGELLLAVTTQFTAPDLKGSYQIDGPDGPESAKNKILFNASFVMKAKE